MRSIVYIVLWLCLCGWLTSSAELLSRLALRQSSLSKQIVEKITAISARTLGTEELAQLLQVSNVQEIIWRLRETGDAEAADSMYQFISDQLQHSKVIAMENIGRGSSNPQLVELEGGLRAIFKSNKETGVDVEREILLHKIDYEIGTNIVPITVSRTIKGRDGSLQLFIENSLAADEMATHKLKALGFEGVDVEIGVHTLHSPLTPELSPAAKTLQLLTVEGDGSNSGNHLLPKNGRQVAIDGSYAFDDLEYIAELRINELQSNLSSFLLDARIAAKFEAILNAGNDHPILQAIRRLDIGEVLAYDDLIDTHSVELNMRLVLAAYRDALARPQRVKLSDHERRAKLLELLSARNWKAADDMLSSYADLRVAFNHFAPDLQELAVRKREHELLRWLHTNASSASLKLSQHDVVNYAIHAGYVDFALRLKALGFEANAPDTVGAWQASIYHALNFGDLKLATRLMDKLTTHNNGSTVEFMLSLLQVEGLASNVRKLRWLLNYEEFFTTRELAADERVVNQLAVQIKRYAGDLASVNTPTADSTLKMVAFLARICSCSSDRIVQAFKQLEPRLQTITEDQIAERLNKIAEVLQENGMPSVDASVLVSELKTELQSYDSVDELSKAIASILSR